MPVNVYSLDIQIAATAYIKAESEEEARNIASDLPNDFIEFSDRHQTVGDDICVDGTPFRGLWENDETTALSPAMTITGVSNLEGLELVEEDIDVEEDENVD
jgi:hypothetical protein